MKKLIFLVLWLLLILKSYPQEEYNNFDFKFFPTVQIGFFNPEDVNDKIAEDLSDYSIIYGTTDIVLSFNIGIGFNFRLFNLIELEPLVEYSIAPKMISGAGNYFFTKYSGGLMVNFLIPFSAERKNSLIFGGGMLYNNMSFEEYNGSSFNPRIHGGLSLNNNRFNPQILLVYDLAKATDKNNDYFELDYSSFRIGVNLNF